MEPSWEVVLNSLLLRIWKAIRWLPGVFWLSQKIYSSRFVNIRQIAGAKRNKTQEMFHLLMVLPDSDLNPLAFKPGMGNISFELFQSAKERYGDSAVTYIPESILKNSTELAIAEFRRKRGTHVLINPESPAPPEVWWMPQNIQHFYAQTGATFWFYLFDSVHWDHIFKLNHLIEIVDQSAALAIDRHLRGLLNQKAHAAEPQCLPISSATLRQLPSAPLDFDSADQVSFVGGMYGYREKVLSKISPLTLKVNPQNDGSQRADYQQYLLALWRSKATLNFSRASSYKKVQLKSRVLEASIMGCPVITDDGGLAADFLGGHHLVVTAKKTRDLKRLLANGEWTNLAARIDRQQLMQTARTIAPVGFWKSLENADFFIKPNGQFR